MTSPSPQSFPVFFNLLPLYFRHISCFGKFLFCFFHCDIFNLAKVSLLKFCDFGSSTIFPQNYKTLIVCTGKHSTKRIPSNTIYGSRVTFKNRKQPLASALICREKTLHLINISLKVGISLCFSDFGSW